VNGSPKKIPSTTLATVCIPSIFDHTPDMDKRFRGSGRLSAIASNAAEEDAYYICLDLSGNWGLCNRLQTIVLMLQFCSWHRLGIYILWTKNEACPGLFDELFDIDFQSPSLNSVPFIKVFDNAANSSWKASIQNKSWSLGYMSAQCNVQDSLKTIMEQYNILKKKKNTRCDKMIDQLLPRIEKCDGADMWQAIELKQSLMDLAKEHMQICATMNPSGLLDHHIAIHVRRGDYKYFNCDLHLASPSVPIERQLQIQEEKVTAGLTMKALQDSALSFFKSTFFKTKY
jgi:hypothetical protein